MCVSPDARGLTESQLVIFIFVELLLFPILCGVELSVLATPIFGINHFLYFSKAPLTFLFLYWASGTAFMFLFAKTISTCRSVFRPGVLFFIRDPQSADFHPMREILERSS